MRAARAATIIVAMLMLLGGVLLATPPAAGAVIRPSGAILYADINYGGGALTITASIPDLAHRGFADAASSIRAGDGQMASFYTEPYYRGTCFAVRDPQQIADLRASGFNDTIASVRYGQDCTDPATANLSDPATKFALLCAEANCTGATLTVEEDIPDLAAVGFDNRSSFMYIRNSFSAAVYADAEFAGRCETIATPSWALIGSTIGNDTISSIRLNATCHGPVRSAPIVSDLRVIAGDSDDIGCASGYTRKPQDLNEDAGGKFIYLCVEYSPYRPGRPYVDKVYAINYFTSLRNCGNDTDTFISQDLNQGAGGDYIYLCYHRATTSSPGTGVAVENIAFARDSDFGSLEEDCGSALNHEKPYGGFDYGSVYADDRDLNAGVLRADPLSIFTCAYQPSRAQDSRAPHFRLPTHLRAIGDPRSSPPGGLVNFYGTALLYDGTDLPLRCDNGIGAGSHYGAYGTALGFIVLPVGTRTVTCTAQDDEGTSHSASFPVTVTLGATTLAASAATGTYGGTVTLSATLRDSGNNGVAGQAIAFALPGGTTRNATTGADGVATATNVPLTGIAAGTYTGGIVASFAGAAGFGASSTSADLAVTRAAATLALGNLGQTYDGTPKAATATTNPVGLAGVAIRYAQGGATVASPTAAGSYDVVAALEHPNYQAPDAVGVLVIAPAGQSVAFDLPAAGASFTYAPGATFAIRAVGQPGGPPLAYAAVPGSACTVAAAPNGDGSRTVTLTGAGQCAIGATQPADANHAAASAEYSVAIAKGAQAITFGPLADRTVGEAPFPVNATSDSGLPVAFAAAGACDVAGATVTLTATGTCTITASVAEDADYLAAQPVARDFAVRAAPPPPVPTTHTLTVSAIGAGTVTPATGTHRAGTRVELRPAAAAGHLFIGWEVDGKARGWPNPLTITMDGDHTVVARFAPVAAFCDVAAGHPDRAAIAELAARGVIKGYVNGCYGPDDSIQRAQLAVLIVRALGWERATASPTSFSDRDGIDDELWRAVGILAERGVARGYGDGTFGPTDEVTRAQAISFITRAMVAQGWWTLQPDDPTIYPNVPASAGHRRDLVTYVKYAGALPGTTPTQAWGGASGWDRPATRAWFAQVLWRALDGHWSVDRAP